MPPKPRQMTLTAPPTTAVRGKEPDNDNDDDAMVETGAAGTGLATTAVRSAKLPERSGDVCGTVEMCRDCRGDGEPPYPCCQMQTLRAQIHCGCYCDRGARGGDIDSCEVRFCWLLFHGPARLDGARKCIKAHGDPRTDGHPPPVPPPPSH